MKTDTKKLTKKRDCKPKRESEILKNKTPIANGGYYGNNIKKAGKKCIQKVCRKWR